MQICSIVQVIRKTSNQVLLHHFYIEILLFMQVRLPKRQKMEKHSIKTTKKG